MSDASPLQRRLASELRAARTAAGLAQAAMGRLVGVSQKTVSRIEDPADPRLPDRRELAAWLETADDEVRARLEILVDAAHVETQSWGSLRRSGHLQDVAAADEDVATRMRCYTSGFLPGLLQTDGYARALMPLVDPDGDHAAAVAARMQRQQRLYEDGHHFEFLMAEATLWWWPTDGVRAAQLDRLVSASTLPNVEIAVLPARRTGAPAWHDFIVWDGADVPTWVTVELLHARSRTADPELVALYQRLWKQLWSTAVHGDDALRLIRDSPAAT